MKRINYETLLKEDIRALVKKAENLAGILKNKGSKESNDKSRAQLRNLLEVIFASACPEEVYLYLGYVKGKQGTKNFWEHTADEARKIFEEVANLAKERAKLNNINEQRAIDELIKHYFIKFVGYLIWQYTYLTA